jgi:hypothetical protein
MLRAWDVRFIPDDPVINAVSILPDNCSDEVRPVIVRVVDGQVQTLGYTCPAPHIRCPLGRGNQEADNLPTPRELPSQRRIRDRAEGPFIRTVRLNLTPAECDTLPTSTKNRGCRWVLVGLNDTKAVVGYARAVSDRGKPAIRQDAHEQYRARNTSSGGCHSPPRQAPWPETKTTHQLELGARSSVADSITATHRVRASISGVVIIHALDSKHVTSPDALPPPSPPMSLRPEDDASHSIECRHPCGTPCTTSAIMPLGLWIVQNWQTVRPFAGLRRASRFTI